ncbi:SlyX family protein [Dongshaea marina]|uniref:SlyX family protein n=1 Tax=Dongshaea marina TaxID=2047966 RepID=UPI000D3E2C67|nr:SlyX family protein [Dongshaea marina]
MSQTSEQITQLEQRIEQLETQLAFQEDSLQQLNQELHTQQQETEKLKIQMQYLVNKMKETQVSQIASQSEETPPPHY